MEILLEGKTPAEKIKSTFEDRLNYLKKNVFCPKLAVLALNMEDASASYVRRIENNCQKYGIGFELFNTNSENEFVETFKQVKSNSEYTSIMFQEPLPKQLANLINQIEENRDVEGISDINMGKLFKGDTNVNIPCTSRSVIEILNFYKIDLKGKNVVVIGRSNIVGKPLIPQLLNANATVTICHSKTQNMSELVKQADVVIVAVGNSNFLKKEMIKDDAVVVDVGINYVNGKLVGDVDYESVKDKAFAITPVPGGVGIVTNALLIENIIASAERMVKKKEEKWVKE